jgi:hypothetical protein
MRWNVGDKLTDSIVLGTVKEPDVRFTAFHRARMI